MRNRVKFFCLALIIVLEFYPNLLIRWGFSYGLTFLLLILGIPFPFRKSIKWFSLLYSFFCIDLSSYVADGGGPSTLGQNALESSSPSPSDVEYTRLLGSPNPPTPFFWETGAEGPQEATIVPTEPEAPSHPQSFISLFNEEERKDRLRGRLILLSCDKPLEPDAREAIVEVQFIIEREVEKELIKKGYAPQSLVQNWSKVVGFLFEGDPLSVRSYRQSWKSIETSGLVNTKFFLRIDKAINHHKLFLEFKLVFSHSQIHLSLCCSLSVWSYFCFILLLKTPKEEEIR